MTPSTSGYERSCDQLVTTDCISGRPAMSPRARPAFRRPDV